MAPAVPMVEIADDRDARRIGRPDGEMNAIGTLMMDRMRAELVEKSQMRALGDIVIVHWAEHGPEGIGIDDRPFAGLVSGAIAQCRAARGLDRTFEKAAIMPARECADRRPTQGLDADLIGARDDAARDPLAIAFLEAEACEWIAMRARNQRGNLGVIKLPFGLRPPASPCSSRHVPVEPSEFATECLWLILLSLSRRTLMATAKDLRRLALALEGTSEAPHFDRAAFKVKRNYVTLAADGLTANFKFTPDEQEFKCMMAPEAFAPVPNAWGRQGWTTANLSKLSLPELKSALETAWSHALPKKRL